MPDGVLIEAPEQGRVHVEANQPLAFGWTMISVDHRDARLRSRRLIEGLRRLGARARQPSKPLAGGFQVLEVRDVIADSTLKEDSEFAAVNVTSEMALDAGEQVALLSAPQRRFRGKASFATLAHVVVHKFDHHLPLYRQAEMMAAQGIDGPIPTVAARGNHIALAQQPDQFGLTRRAVAEVTAR